MAALKTNMVLNRAIGRREMTFRYWHSGLANPSRFDAPRRTFQHFATILDGTVETIEFII
jgi:ribosomal protein S24E